MNKAEKFISRVWKEYEGKKYLKPEDIYLRIFGDVEQKLGLNWVTNPNGKIPPEYLNAIEDKFHSVKGGD